jgi:uncharacterized protein YjbJ (UPF0337 family)
LGYTVCLVGKFIYRIFTQFCLGSYDDVIGFIYINFLGEGVMDLKQQGFWNQLEGNWKQFKGDAKLKWGELTDDEVDQVEGNKDKLVGLIQKKYGVMQEDAARQVEDWAEHYSAHH